MTTTELPPTTATHGGETSGVRPGRVVHVTAHYPPYVGGVENAVASIAEELTRTHAGVEVLTSDIAAEGYPHRAVERRVRVRRYRTFRIGNTPIFPGLLFGLLRQPRGTVVHAHGPHAFVGETCRLACRLRGMPLVLHVHLEVGRSTRWGVLLPLYRRFVNGPTLRSADRVVALTPELATQLEQRYRLDPGRVRVVPNAVDLDVAGAHAERAVHGGPLRVLYLGRLVPQKRVSRLLEAISLCPEPIELVVVGDGELRTELEAQARRLGVAARFTGAVERDGVAGWLRWADAFALPSEREGMPLSVLEAMAAGVPVLATDVEGTRDLVAGHGLLVDTTPEALSDGLVRLARDPGLRADLAARGRERAHRDTWPSIVDTLVKEYDAVSSTTDRPTHRSEASREGAEEVPAFRAMDSTDASWASILYTRSMWGVEPGSLEDVRRALGLVLAQSPVLCRTLDVTAQTWRPLTAAELAARPAAAVLAGAAYETAQEADAAAFAVDLAGMPFRIVVGPNYLILRATHAFGDEWSAVAVLNHLMAQARTGETLPVPWTEVSPRTRRRITARQLATHPRAVLTALRRRRELSGGPFEPARLNADRLPFVCTLVVSREGFLPDLRAERTARGLEVSLAAISLTGLRAAIAEHLEAPVAGAEIVYDVRREAPESERAIGNWVAGVFVVPDDDTDPVAVHRAMGAVREQGLSLVAAAATRRKVRRGGDRGDRLVFAPGAGLRLTLSYIPGHGPLKDAPFVGPDHAYFGTNPPNGINTVTLTCAEVGDRMHLGIEHYPDTWSREAVERAVAAFLADPFADRSRPTEPTRTTGP